MAKVFKRPAPDPRLFREDLIEPQVQFAQRLIWNQMLLSPRLVRPRSSRNLRPGEPKPPRSARTLDLPPTVIDTLRSRRARQAEERLVAGQWWTDRARLCHESRDARGPEQPASQLRPAHPPGWARQVAPPRTAPFGSIPAFI